jgi:hypothetical protein
MLASGAVIRRWGRRLIVAWSGFCALVIWANGSGRYRVGGLVGVALICLAYVVVTKALDRAESGASPWR